MIIIGYVSGRKLSRKTPASNCMQCITFQTGMSWTMLRAQCE